MLLEQFEPRQDGITSYTASNAGPEPLVKIDPEREIVKAVGSIFYLIRHVKGIDPGMSFVSISNGFGRVEAKRVNRRLVGVLNVDDILKMKDGDREINSGFTLSSIDQTGSTFKFRYFYPTSAIEISRSASDQESQGLFIFRNANRKWTTENRYRIGSLDNFLGDTAVIAGDIKRHFFTPQPFQPKISSRSFG